MSYRGARASLEHRLACLRDELAVLEGKPRRRSKRVRELERRLAHLRRQETHRGCRELTPWEIAHLRRARIMFACFVAVGVLGLAAWAFYRARHGGPLFEPFSGTICASFVCGGLLGFWGVRSEASLRRRNVIARDQILESESD